MGEVYRVRDTKVGRDAAIAIWSAISRMGWGADYHTPRARLEILERLGAFCFHGASTTIDNAIAAPAGRTSTMNAATKCSSPGAEYRSRLVGSGSGRYYRVQEDLAARGGVVSMRVSFGDFVLDRGTRQLLRGAEVCHLGPKAFELLELLLGHRPNVVPKERIRDRLWPEIFVSDWALASVVAELRSALDEAANAPRFVRTVHRVGYAFCGEAHEAHEAAPEPFGPTAYRLVLLGREVDLRAGENLLGRVSDGVAWIDSSSVSRRHARILIGGGAPLLEDLGSKNGTFLHGERISVPTPLADGDVFRLGRVNITLRALRDGITTGTDAG
jgi:DNA-binding winged helix-turn-helix (wHTH) protein